MKEKCAVRNVIKWAAIVVSALIAAFFAVRAIGRNIRQNPEALLWAGDDEETLK
jgi:hypothetical protein